MKSTEHVVLLNEQKKPYKTAPKATIHTQETPLHLGFSCFIFNDDQELLLQQRALSKITWPGVWSNSVCGHPAWEEPYIDAVKRRAKFELGIQHLEPVIALPDYQYKAEFNSIVENEVCPVFVAHYNQELQLNPDEVAATQWVNWQDFIKALMDPANTTWDHLSHWCKEEAKLLNKTNALKLIFDV